MGTRKTFKNSTNVQWARVADDGDQLNPPSQIPTRAINHNGHEPCVDEYGRLWVRVATLPSNATTLYTSGFYQTTVLGTSGDIKTTPGTLLQVWGVNTDPNNLAFFQLFDETGPPPANGTVPLVSIPVLPNNGVFALSLNQPDAGVPSFPVPFNTNGIEWAVSSTIAILTLAATPFWVNAIYI